jgi:5-methylcytosine-specific restriction endonuclease McrA
MKKINDKCLGCSKTNWRDKANIEPKCYVRERCAKKRSYYRNIEHYRAKLREYHRYLKFLGDKCLVCGKTEPLEVHHIHSQANGGIDSQVNTITLCHECHKVITIYTRRLGLERPLLQ